MDVSMFLKLAVSVSFRSRGRDRYSVCLALAFYGVTRNRSKPISGHAVS